MSLRDQLGLRIKLHDLRVLIAVAEAGSMSKAAVRLNTTQPAISRSITELERMVGAPLLERSATGVTPTSYGRELLVGGLAAFDCLRQAATNIECLADPTAGEVNIGCTPILGATFVSRLIGSLSDRHPRMVFNVTTGYLHDLRRQLAERALDLLIVRRFSPEPDEPISFAPLSQDHYVIAVGARHPLATRRRVALEDLANFAWTLPPAGSVIGSLARDAFSHARISQPRPTVIANSTDVRLSLLQTGRFVTIFPASLLGSGAAAPEVKVLSTNFSLGIAENVVATVSDRRLCEAAQTFVMSAREAAWGQSVGLRL